MMIMTTKMMMVMIIEEVEYHASPLPLPEPQEDPCPNIAPGWKFYCEPTFTYVYMLILCVYFDFEHISIMDKLREIIEIAVGQIDCWKTLFFMLSGAQLISFILMAVQNMPSALPVM